MKTEKKKMSKNRLIYRSLLFSSVALFVGCSGFLIYYLGIQPYYSRQINNKYKAIYYSSGNVSEDGNTSEDETIDNSKKPLINERSYTLDGSYKKGAKNSDGILLKFQKLLEYNSDTKGWLSIPGTNIDYPVMQAFNGSDFYLYRDFEGSTDKNGCLFIDKNCNVEKPTKNIVIHGHNMESTKMMFYELPQYKDINFYKEHPIITFDSIYKESKWKIISFMRVSGNAGSNGDFNYMQGTFENDEEFLDFLYQIEMRSLYKCPVDVNENDRLLMLSTCTYEVHNYRTVVVARKLRKGESAEVDISKAKLREDVLYPPSWYSRYDGEAPITTSFADAMSFNEIDWYDGDQQVETSLGKIVEYENAKYEITSPTTLKYVECKETKAKQVVIPSTIKLDGRKFEVTELSKHAFDNMKKLEYLKIGNKITKIPSKAFIQCKKLEYVIIGDSVESIGKKAFYNLEKLQKIKIRCLNLTTIESKALKGVSPKAKIKLPEKLFKKYSKLLEDYGLSEDIKLVKYKS